MIDVDCIGEKLVVEVYTLRSGMNRYPASQRSCATVEALHACSIEYVCLCHKQHVTKNFRAVCSMPQMKPFQF